MADVKHGTLQPGAASGIHVIHDWVVANAAARLALSVTASQVGKVCRQLDNNSFWVLASSSPVTWTPFGGGGDLSDATPVGVDAGAAAPGTAPSASRADHKHTVAVGTPVGVGTANAAGSSTSLARADHVHAHGSQAGGTLHAPATTSVAGFMSSADKTKLDGLSPGSGPSAPASPPPDVAAAGATGTVGTYATATHTHGHGDQGGGTLHAPATTSVAGFLSAADKTKLDGIPPGGGGGAVSSVFTRVGAVVAVLGDYTSSLVTNVSSVAGATVSAALDALQTAIAAKAGVTSTAPVNVTKAAAAVGAATDAARADHKHDVTTAAAVPIATGATASSEGTATSLARSDHVHALAAADRTKLDGAAALTSSAPATTTKAAAVVGVAVDAARADHKHDVSTAVVVAVGAANAEGSATSLARSDHVHDASAKADKLFSIRTTSATSVTLGASDNAGMVRLTAATNVTFTLPADATLNLTAGFTTTIVCEVTGEGSAVVTWDAAVTPIAGIPSYGVYRLYFGAAMTVSKLASNRWLLKGDIAWSDA